MGEVISLRDRPHRQAAVKPIGILGKPTSRAARGSVEWAKHILAAWRAAVDRRADLRHVFDKRARQVCLKPKFTPAGAGYEGINATQARKIIIDKILNLGPEELKLAAALRSHDDTFAAWAAARERLRDQMGVSAADAQCDALDEDWRAAVRILDEAGIEWRGY